jgi:transcriptional regulator with XRE-family HTH domain
MHHMATFGKHIRKLRKAKGLSVRQLAKSVEKDHGYLSRIEAGKVPPPSAELIQALAAELEEDPDVLMAMAGRMPEGLQEIIAEHPKLFATLIRQLKGLPKDALLRVVREVKDGDW